jgi:hypothetical protein
MTAIVRIVTALAASVAGTPWLVEHQQVSPTRRETRAVPVRSTPPCCTGAARCLTTPPVSEMRAAPVVNANPKPVQRWSQSCHLCGVAIVFALESG